MKKLKKTHKCAACDFEYRKQKGLNWEDGVKDYIKYHKTDKYEEHIKAGIKALQDL